MRLFRRKPDRANAAPPCLVSLSPLQTSLTGEDLEGCLGSVVAVGGDDPQTMSMPPKSQSSDSIFKQTTSHGGSSSCSTPPNRPQSLHISSKGANNNLKGGSNASNNNKQQMLLMMGLSTDNSPKTPVKKGKLLNIKSMPNFSLKSFKISRFTIYKIIAAIVTKLIGFTKINLLSKSLN